MGTRERWIEMIKNGCFLPGDNRGVGGVMRVGADRGSHYCGS